MLYSFNMPKVSLQEPTQFDRAASDPTTYILVGILLVAVLGLVVYIRNSGRKS